MLIYMYQKAVMLLLKDVYNTSLFVHLCSMHTGCVTSLISLSHFYFLISVSFIAITNYIFISKSVSFLLPLLFFPLRFPKVSL